MKDNKIDLFDKFWGILGIVIFAIFFALAFLLTNIIVITFIVFGFFCFILLAYGVFKKNTEIKFASLAILIFGYLIMNISYYIIDQSFPSLGLMLVYVVISIIGFFTIFAIYYNRKIGIKL